MKVVYQVGEHHIRFRLRCHRHLLDSGKLANVAFSHHHCPARDGATRVGTGSVVRVDPRLYLGVPYPFPSISEAHIFHASLVL